MAYVRFSQVLADQLLKKGVPVNRDTLQEMGERIRESPGQRWLERELLKRAENKKEIVIDGLRFAEDRAFMVESFGPRFVHIHVEASYDTRRTRYIKSGKAGAEFDRASLHLIENETQSLGECAHSVIENEGTQQGFLSAVTRAISKRK